MDPDAPDPQEDQAPQLNLDLPEDGDTLAITKSMRAQMLVDAKLAKAGDNFTAAQRYMRDAANLTAVIARLEKTAANDDDVLRISRVEIEETMIALEQRVETLASRPLLCADCSRKLSISYGAGKTKAGEDVG